MKLKSLFVVVLCLSLPSVSWAVCPYDANCLNNLYGAESPYKSDGLMNPYGNVPNQ